MVQLIRRIPLLARVTIALGLVAVLPLGYAIWSLLDVNRAGMHEQVLRTHAVAASTAADRIGAIVDARSALARSLAANADLASDPRSPVTRQFLQELIAADPGVWMVDVITPAGDIVIRAQRRGAAENADVAAHARQFRPLRLWQSGSSSWLLASEPLPEGRGTLRLLADGEPIVDALDPAEIGDQAEMALATGTELLAGDARLGSFPPQMLTAARSARVNGTGVYIDAAGNEILGAFAPIDDSGWFVLSRQPSAIAQKIAGTMRRRALLAAGVALALAVMIGIAAQRTVLAPIREVIRSQQQLTGRRAASGANEIDQLRETSELLRRRIVDQEDLDRVFLGRFQVLGIIGQGGMGTVFRGWDPKLRRHVALKTVRFDEIQPEETAEMVDSLVAEAITAASINHPNIVAVYDVEDSLSAAFIAMELVEGVSLQSFLDQRDRLTPSQAVLVGHAVARALEAAHQRTLLHRDIKPGNVLLGFDGSMKVTDFGLAALISTLKASQAVVYGTPGYIAPESATGSGADARSDLFSLGVVVYQSVTGSNPFDRDTPRETMVATVVATPEPLAATRSDDPVLPELSDLVSRLMEKKPEARPGSAADVAHEFEQLIQKFRLQWKLDRMEGGMPLLTGHSSARLVPTIGMRRRSR